MEQPQALQQRRTEQQQTDNHGNYRRQQHRARSQVFHALGQGMMSGLQSPAIPLPKKISPKHKANAQQQVYYSCRDIVKPQAHRDHGHVTPRWMRKIALRVEDVP